MLPRRVPIFTEGKLLAITVRSKTASLLAQHSGAIGQFSQTNEPDVLAKFEGRVVKDIHGKSYSLETDPNVLHQLLSAGGEPFEEIYRIII